MAVSRSDRPAVVPEKPSIEGLERRWSEAWEAEGTYRFDRDAPADRIYSIDTPPPTVSGSLHVGHVFSYTHTDLMARYLRMRGRAVFYPMGWDDNGLPTERRVQNYYGVRCVPSVPYDPDFRPPPANDGRPVEISRRNFVELCYELTQEDEQVFERMWRQLGLSVDWSLQYTTIGPSAQRVSQQMFLDLAERGIAYQAEAPALWDIDFQSAVAQAELEDREVTGRAYRIGFARADGGGEVEIETTRPELLAACVGVLVHPEDERYGSLVGRTVRTPLFEAPVEVHAHPLVEREKGTGAVMVCTFGDLTDVIWWRELGLRTRPILGHDGRLLPVEWGTPGWESDDPARANASYDRIAGQKLEPARNATAELLTEAGAMRAEPVKVRRPVKFFEKGDRPVEIVTSRQWFIRTMDCQDELIGRAREIEWHPPYMRMRLEDWIRGLTGDWCISRQRYFGVPFPAWYPIDAEGTVLWNEPIFAAPERLPVDPSSELPPGYTDEQRGRPGGFRGDSDVMDTWATSSLSPEIAGRKLEEPELYERIYPMDLRPQAHDIIRTWLFSTVVRAHFAAGTIPWRNAAISGWVLDPDRKKMSKSKGNVVTPVDLLEEYGSDAVRYWAARGRPGVDTAFDPRQMKVGRRLAVKILNASRFVLNDLPPAGPVVNPLDAAMLERVAGVVEAATEVFDDYDYTRALERTETAFWWWCDYYLELVKGRRYSDPESADAQSASGALQASLEAFLLLFAPFLPFVTEEVWSWWRPGSVHTSAWPAADDLRARISVDGADESALDVAGEVLTAVRKAKSDAQQGMRIPVERVTVRDEPRRLDALASVEGDVRDAGRIEDLALEPADEPAIDVVLGQA
jgi:valyl-tRNA synthetase